MGTDSNFGTKEKAFQINLDPRKHGTFAEIGAGQEVARWFFHVGGASGTVAKTISAYDMKFSDAIYGPCEHYVSRQRLLAMLDHEYALLVERLDQTRGANTTFFVFADTVAARSHTRHGESHGWVGIRFQTRPRAGPSQIIAHLRLKDTQNVQEQEALGIFGVNLTYGALHHHDDPPRLIGSLLDDLTADRIEVDMIRFSGRAFQKIDNRVMSLELVGQGLTNAAMFRADGEVVQPAEVLYQKPILVERGNFRPVNLLNVDMIHCAHRQFLKESAKQEGEPLVLMEMTLQNLLSDTRREHSDFLARVDTLAILGNPIMISNYGEYFHLPEQLSRYTNKMIGLVIGVPALKNIFDEKFYAPLEGGILESFGRLFRKSVTLYVYPLDNRQSRPLVTAENLRVQQHLQGLYRYLIENRRIEPLRGVDEACLTIDASDVAAGIRMDDAAWANRVPAQVARMIRDRQLFDYRAECRTLS